MARDEDFMIPVDIREVILDSQSMDTREIGEMMLHVFKCWRTRSVSDCCPPWAQRAFAKASLVDFRGYIRAKRESRYYGPSWAEIRRNVLARDRVCKACGDDGHLDVHHKIPFRAFDDRDEANAMDNLVALCRPCHAAADHAYRNLGIIFVGAPA